jgi:hypothetical protein
LISVEEGATFGAGQFAALIAAGAGGVTALTAAAAEMGVFVTDSLAELIVFGMEQTATLINFQIGQVADFIDFAAQGITGLAGFGAQQFALLVQEAVTAGVFFNTQLGGLVTFAIDSLLPAPIAGALTAGRGICHVWRRAVRSRHCNCRTTRSRPRRCGCSVR